MSVFDQLLCFLLFLPIISDNNKFQWLAFHYSILNTTEQVPSRQFLPLYALPTKSINPLIDENPIEMKPIPSRVYLYLMTFIRNSPLSISPSESSNTNLHLNHAIHPTDHSTLTRRVHKCTFAGIEKNGLNFTSLWTLPSRLSFPRSSAWSSLFVHQLNWKLKVIPISKGKHLSTKDCLSLLVYLACQQFICQQPLTSIRKPSETINNPLRISFLPLEHVHCKSPPQFNLSSTSHFNFPTALYSID